MLIKIKSFHFIIRNVFVIQDNEDLFYYIMDGYHNKITRDMTGQLLKDMLTNIKNENNRFYFAHSETIMPFLTRLGIAKDTPQLSLRNIQESRKWRTALIGGESSNLAVAVFRWWFILKYKRLCLSVCHMISSLLI